MWPVRAVLRIASRVAHVPIEVVHKTARFLVINPSCKLVNSSLHACRRCIIRKPKAVNSNQLALEDECPVCYDRLRRPTYLPCGHKACRACLKKWAQTSIEAGLQPTCPICRAEFCPHTFGPPPEIPPEDPWDPKRVLIGLDEVNSFLAWRGGPPTLRDWCVSAGYSSYEEFFSFQRNIDVWVALWLHASNAMAAVESYQRARMAGQEPVFNLDQFPPVIRHCIQHKLQV